MAARSEVELVLARFRLLALRRSAWLQHLWSQEEVSNTTDAVSHAEIALILADKDSPEAQSDWLEEHEPARSWQAELDTVEQDWAALAHSRFARLAQIFGLSRFEVDLLQSCAALSWDPPLARVAAYLHDHAGRPYLSSPLVARLYGHDPIDVSQTDSALFRWELARRRELGPEEPHAIEGDPQICDWLRGQPMLDQTLAEVAQVRLPQPALAHWPVKDCVQWLQKLLDEKIAGRLVVTGSRGSGRRTFAAVVADELRLPLMVVDVDAFPDSDWRTVFLRAQRQGYMNTCALGWVGENLSRRTWPRHMAGFPVQFLLCEPGQEPGPVPGIAERRICLPSPGAAERSRLWRLHLPAANQWPPIELAAIAERHRVQPGDIVTAACLGVTSPAEAAWAVRESKRGRLGGLAQPIECPFTWDDLVVPGETRKILETIANEAEQRAAFWEQPSARRLFPQGQGLLALFSGPPGTGKTMAAQVIAAHLRQDLFRVNLAQYVSKWVGETAKHCELLINQASEMDAVLFFDEADALFAKRSSEMRDAQDRFANTDAAHLLQAIEGYTGVALLATNLKGNIDPAFFRRLRYIVEFSKPDAAQRRLLWDRLVRELAGEARQRSLAPALDAIAAGIEATAAQTKYALLGALFAARRERVELSARHLLLGLENELSKEGRAISPRDREKILRHNHAA
jgi:adenylate kinase family enzyme